MNTENDRVPYVETLGLLEAPAPALRRARRRRAFWAFLGAIPRFFLYGLFAALLSLAALASWAFAPLYRTGRGRLANWSPTDHAVHQVKREWKP